MAPSQACVENIKHFEGFRSKPYRCPAGVPTIGYGHTDGVRMTDPAITEAQAEELLRMDLQAFAAGVNRLVRVALTQGQFDALVSFAYNVGLGNLQRSTLLKKLNAGDYSGAAAEFGRWTKAADGQQLPGLVRRRAAERALFEA